MLRLISDQNFNGRILRGIGLRIPDLDLVRALDAGLAKAPDPVLLNWAAVIGVRPISKFIREDAGRSVSL